MFKPIDVGHLMVRDLSNVALIGAQYPPVAGVLASVSRMDLRKLAPGIFRSLIACAGEAVWRMPRLLPVPRLPRPALEIARHMPAIMARSLIVRNAPWLPREVSHRPGAEQTTEV
jgi:hypothetical protein